MMENSMEASQKIKNSTPGDTYRKKNTNSKSSEQHY